MAYEKLLVNGTDIASVVDCTMDLSGLYKSPDTRGGNIVIPGRDGEVQVAKQFDTNIIDIPVMLAGSTATTFNDSLRVLRQLLVPGTALSLERQISTTAGNEQHTATGELASNLSPSISLERFGRLMISIRVLDGTWHKKTAVAGAITTSGSFSVAGDVRTRRMTITLSAAGTLVNTTTGHSLTLTGSGGDIDVEAMTAVNGATDISRFLTWTKGFPMELAPGTNNFTFGGTATFSYKPAYL